MEVTYFVIRVSEGSQLRSCPIFQSASYVVTSCADRQLLPNASDLRKASFHFLSLRFLSPPKNGTCFAGYISETWLKPQIPDGELNIPVRQDRIGKSEGGTMIYVKDGIPFHERPDAYHLIGNFGNSG